MSEPVRHLLELFDALPDQDKRVAVEELLHRSPHGYGDISAPAFDALADELFADLDLEEAARAVR